MSEAVATSQQGLAGKYKPYPEYKDSGLEWLGEIPAHWNISRIKYVAQLNPSKSEVRGLSDDTIVSFIPMEAIGERGEIDVSRTRLLGDVLTGYSYITDGDVILAKITPCFENGKGAVVHGLENGIGFATTEVIPARPYRKCDAQFLYYLFTSNPFKALAEGSMYGAGGQKRVADSFVAEYHFAEAPTDERENIAAFLDYETARIDRLIAQQQRLIELLKEKRQAVISHAVTKGLNPNAPMKDSGVEWLGQVPEHWQLTKLKWISKTTSGSTPNTSEPEKYYDDGVYPWVRTTDLNNGRLVNTPVHITDAAIKDTACSLLPIGSVLIAMYGGAGSIGKHALLAVEATTNQAVCAILPSAHLVPEYLDLFAEYYRPFWMVSAEGTRKDPNIGQDHIREMLLPIPPLDEQNEIQAYIYVQISLYEKGQDIAIKQMGLLQERRTALISAAVTGKIDLRSWNPPHA
ncbi:restriction endonuclease subunit S [Aeromonas caviae]|uniref:restriction endonuclease subunit S n=1 Tax=Aeromonas caviae TaxID=648 RepID=UPI003F747D60